MRTADRATLSIEMDWISENRFQLKVAFLRWRVGRLNQWSVRPDSTLGNFSKAMATSILSKIAHN